MSRDGSSAVPGSKSPSGGSKGNKFDPSFHEHRARELQPLLTALCERSDVFGLTKFMKWLFFEKRCDTPLLALFDVALRGTLEEYKVVHPVYANNMVDALTWLMFFRISHLWDKLRKSIHFLAVRAVQDLILKAIRPLDEMILRLNGISSHIHNILKIQPTVFTKPKSHIDAIIRTQFQLTFTAYHTPIQALLQVMSTELTAPLTTIANFISSNFMEIHQLAYKNIQSDGDEAQVTALVAATDALFTATRSELLPLLQHTLTALHNNISSKFNSPILQSSFSAIGRIVPTIPKLIDALLPQQTILDFFVAILQLRDASDALEKQLTTEALTGMLNQMETDFEREIERLHASSGLKSRTYHAAIRRIHASCIPLAAPIGDSMLKMGNTWCKYLRKFFRLASNLLAAQQLSTIPVGWIFSSRDCIELALRKASEYVKRKALKIVSNLLSACIVALMEPLTVSTINQVYPSILPTVDNELSKAMIPAPPNFHPSSSTSSSSSSSRLSALECPLSEILGAQTYISLVARQLMQDSLRGFIRTHIVSPLQKAWEDGQEAREKNGEPKGEVKRLTEEETTRAARLEGVLQRLKNELQQRQMNETWKFSKHIGSSTYAEDRLTVGGVIITNQHVQSQGETSTHPRSGVPYPTPPKSIEVKQSEVAPPSFSESPVAKLIGRVTIEGNEKDSGPSSLDEKRLGKDLPMLARISKQGGAKADASDQLNRDEPALRFDFEIERTEQVAPVSSASNIWAAATASKKLYKQSTRVFYTIPEAQQQQQQGATSSNPQPPTSSQIGTSSSEKDAGSPTRVVPRKPTLSARPSVGKRVAPVAAPATQASSVQSPSSSSSSSAAAAAATTPLHPQPPPPSVSFSVAVPTHPSSSTTTSAPSSRPSVPPKPSALSKASSSTPSTTTMGEAPNSDTAQNSIHQQAMIPTSYLPQTLALSDIVIAAVETGLAEETATEADSTETIATPQPTSTTSKRPALLLAAMNIAPPVPLASSLVEGNHQRTAVFPVSPYARRPGDSSNPSPPQ